MYIENRAQKIVTVFANAASVKDKESVSDMWENLISELDAELPRGSGFDSGSQFLWDESTSEKLIFKTAFHHMNDCGMYDGWTEHLVTVTPSLLFGYKIAVSGRNRNDIKDYIAECFELVLSDYVVTRMTDDKLLTFDKAAYDYGFEKESAA